MVSTEGDGGWTPQMQATAAATQNTVGQVGDSVERRALWDIDRSSVLAAVLTDA